MILPNPELKRLHTQAEYASVHNNKSRIMPALSAFSRVCTYRHLADAISGMRRHFQARRCITQGRAITTIPRANTKTGMGRHPKRNKAKKQKQKQKNETKQNKTKTKQKTKTVVYKVPAR